MVLQLQLQRRPRSSHLRGALLALAAGVAVLTSTQQSARADYLGDAPLAIWFFEVEASRTGDGSKSL